MKPLLISTCLTGLPARYDGREVAHQELLRLLDGLAWIPVCPEQMGGLPIPRPPNSIIDPKTGRPADGSAVLKGEARVVDREGDRTAEFIKGARAVLKLAELTGAGAALLQKNSPSCGPRWGTGSDGGPRPTGVTAALLMEAGLTVYEVGPEGLSDQVRRLLQG